jgi:hypothetical protein
VMGSPFLRCSSTCGRQTSGVVTSLCQLAVRSNLTTQVHNNTSITLRLRDSVEAVRFGGERTKDRCRTACSSTGPFRLLRCGRHGNFSSILTLPTATAVVAMSKTKLSPLFPGAASDKGLVPSAACEQQSVS